MRAASPNQLSFGFAAETSAPRVRRPRAPRPARREPTAVQLTLSFATRNNVAPGSRPASGVLDLTIEAGSLPAEKQPSLGTGRDGGSVSAKTLEPQGDESVRAHRSFAAAVRALRAGLVTILAALVSVLRDAFTYKAPGPRTGGLAPHALARQKTRRARLAQPFGPRPPPVRRAERALSLQPGGFA